MKKIEFLKGGVLHQLTFIAAIFLVSACDNNQRSEDTKETAEKQNDDRFDNNKQEKDAQFLVNAAEINLEEIQLGQLAQQNGRTAHVKELGKMMEDAHKKSQIELTALATSKRITIPNSPTENAKDTYNKLNEKSPDDFDKAYAKMMVDKHEDAIKAFEDATRDSKDKDIKNWAIASLPDMRTHLNHSIECKKKCENM